LDAFAKRVAEETAAKIAMKQAEEKAAAEAEAKAAEEAEVAKTAQQEEVKTQIRNGIETGTERLVADFQEKLNEKDANHSEVLNQFKKELEEKNEELTKMRDSKRVFSDRNGTDGIKGNKDVMYAHLFGVMTNKGWDTDYARDVFEKAGATYPPATSIPELTHEVSQMIEKEIQLELRTAGLFREVAVNGLNTTIPLQEDVAYATWGNARDNSASASAGGTDLGNRGSDLARFDAKQKTLTVDRLISTTFLDNYIDEEVLINLMPMLTEGIARAHARAVDKQIIQGGASNNVQNLNSMAVGITTPFNTDVTSLSAAQVAAGGIKAAHLVGMRKTMGVYGLNPQDVVYIVSQDVYHSLINDAAFDNVFEVGSDAALKLTGQVGAVYGSPVVISDNFPAASTTGDNAGVFAVNTRNFVIPRLRGVTVEQDYEVAAQRRVMVASQHLGFNELFDSVAGKAAAVRLNLI
jgi:hypothetical protein